MKTFDVVTMYATYKDCVLELNEYSNNGHVALSIFSPEEGPIASITVNTDGIALSPKNFSCVDRNNFPEGEHIISELGIGKPTGYTIRSGFVNYPEYEFDMDAIKALID